ncbi:MAG: hypothetical protein ACI4ME_06230 [Aristaeellaceae bacterium]
MKHLLKALLALCAAGMLLCSAAMAEAPACSPELTAAKTAIGALYDQYGFTAEMLGMFTMTVAAEEEATRVHLISTLLPLGRVGEYEVTIRGDQAEAKWTHDDKDESLWASGALDCPYWGAKQLQTCLDKTDYIFGSDGDIPENVPNLYDSLDFTAVPPEKDELPSEERYALARAALADVYGLSEETMSSLESLYGEERILICGDGRRLLEVTIAGRDLCCHVLFDTDTGEVFWIQLSSGGNG